jgi:hypothetical protein
MIVSSSFLARSFASVEASAWKCLSHSLRRPIEKGDELVDDGRSVDSGVT